MLPPTCIRLRLVAKRRRPPYVQHESHATIGFPTAAATIPGLQQTSNSSFKPVRPRLLHRLVPRRADSRRLSGIDRLLLVRLYVFFFVPVFFPSFIFVFLCDRSFVLFNSISFFIFHPISFLFNHPFCSVFGLLPSFLVALSSRIFPPSLGALMNQTLTANSTSL
ncbi:hypothetical protein GALMADRAFT_454288 [Galerina marginata CBS 339.88]|uniref:Transmembrane protein n=1 Tax=Galerina marginata (strain CBS 339.88) TaxID=685588 RepID=A0A067T371_GALM3|nr:hypothetical protein GALMADRAFT_454288 [Galerina marginata CBS 339.88]